jgi:periplasmic divalent cation tolerance protein
MAEEVLIVLTTWPDVEKARAATRTLVEEKLVACGNIVPGVESIYRWEGKVEMSAEVIVIFKTVIGSYQRFETRVRELHPYQVPEIVVLRVTDGLPSYLRWVEQNCG